MTKPEVLNTSFQWAELNEEDWSDIQEYVTILEEARRTLSGRWKATREELKVCREDLSSERKKVPKTTTTGADVGVYVVDYVEWLEQRVKELSW